MNRNTVILSITALVGLLLVTFVFSWYQEQQNIPTSATMNKLETPNAFSFGPDDAKVTIVEFFDPACEACRAMYPVVKSIMESHPKDVRLVIRYAAFHAGSTQVVSLLEAARVQNLYQVVLESLLNQQDSWASHNQPNFANIWRIAGAAGLDVEQAREDMQDQNIIDLVQQDAKDVEALGINKTPTFFVNGKPLETFGAQPLYNLVRNELKNQGAL